MSIRNEEPRHLAALRAERDRLDTVTDVLGDIYDAAAEVAQRKGHRDCTVENEKRAHWVAVHKSAHAEYCAASDAYGEAKFGQKYGEQIRAERARIFADDPEMRALIAKARADLAARHQPAQQVERDRRRSR